MNNEEILKTFKQIITEKLEKAGFEVIEIILFGSQARRDARPDSDWDFYIVVDKEIDFKTKVEIIMWIKRKLASKKIPNDVLIQSQSVSQERRKSIGYVTYNVYKEGIRI